MALGEGPTDNAGDPEQARPEQCKDSGFGDRGNNDGFIQGSLAHCKSQAQATSNTSQNEQGSTFHVIPGHIEHTRIA